MLAESPGWAALSGAPAVAPTPASAVAMMSAMVLARTADSIAIIHDVLAAIAALTAPEVRSCSRRSFQDSIRFLRAIFSARRARIGSDHEIIASSKRTRITVTSAPAWRRSNASGACQQKGRGDSRPIYYFRNQGTTLVRLAIPIYGLLLQVLSSCPRVPRS